MRSAFRAQHEGLPTSLKCDKNRSRLGRRCLRRPRRKKLRWWHRTVPRDDAAPVETPPERVETGRQADEPTVASHHAPR